MNKNEFLELLKNKLDVLEESEVLDIVNEYSEHIDEKIKKNISEEEAIKEFGDIDLLCSSILSAYKINQKYINDKKDSFITNFLNDTKYVFDKIIKILSHGSFKDLIALCLYIIFILIIILVFRIPFIILNNGIESIICDFPRVLFNIFNVIKNILLNGVYIVLAFIVLIKILKEKLLSNVRFVYEEKEETIYKKENDNVESKKSNKNDKVIVKKEEHTKIKYKNEKSMIDSVADIFKFMLRCFTFLMSLPFVVSVLGFSMLFVLLIIFSVEYVFIFGFILITLGLLVISIVFSKALFSYTFKMKFNYIRNTFVFISSLVLIGIGIAVSLYEFTKFEIFDEDKRSNVIISEEKIEYSDEKISCYECDKIESQVDNSLLNNEIKIVVYGKEYLKPYINYYEHDMYEDGSMELKSYIDIYYNLDAVKFLKVLKVDLNKKELYNYDNYGGEVIIYANENVVNKIKIAY